MNWSDPTMIKIMNDESVFPTPYNVVALDADTDGDWTMYVIQDLSGTGYVSFDIHLTRR